MTGRKGNGIGCLSSSTQSTTMSPPLLYIQLHAQLSQWIQPKDKRHLVGFAENVAAILQSGKRLLESMVELFEPSGLQSPKSYGTLKLLCAESQDYR